MNMKCKKLVLLTMQLNNANNQQLKFTRTKIVNLEMFFKVSTNIVIIYLVIKKYWPNALIMELVFCDLNS